ncbi:MAG: DNA photolyase [Actinobacteria bacterium]|nr:MAG: DNA photolyase [Actinomycetota bacterium]
MNYKKYKGNILKLCPGLLDKYLCCRLYVINTISGCPMSCSYCFLQFYLNEQEITAYLDLAKIKKELTELSKSNPNRLFRVTTGELSDSLFYDKELKLSAGIIKIIKTLPNMVLELKTKTANVTHLLNTPLKDRVVFSWSLNPGSVIKNEEKGTASLKARIAAATKCQKAGFLVAFHFDPVVFFEDFEKEYEKTIKALFQEIDSQKIAWISIGTLRFAPGMQDKVKEAYPKSKLPYGEFVKASDGKMRYIKPIRNKLYSTIVSSLRLLGGQDLFIYLCMETEEIFKRALGFAPKTQAHLDYLFAKNLYDNFGIFREPRIADYC